MDKNSSDSLFFSFFPTTDDKLKKTPATRDRQIAYLFIAVYVIANIIYGFLSDAPWDDDCVRRYYNTLAAWEEPKQFFSLWNRPLFIILFFFTAKLGAAAMMIQMVLITALDGFALYKATEKLELRFPYMILPLFFFQAFFFTTSRNNLTEPLAVALVCFGFYFLVQKRWLWFAIAGSLIPLARLELSVLLGVWGIILLAKGQWKYLFVLAAPTVLLNFAGIPFKDDTFWLITETLGEEGEENRYGHQSFWHYFERYIYVIGPVVFYFFFLGMFERIFRRKTDYFVILQFLLGFFLYVIFSWKLDMGNAAGFLRNLIPLTPLAAILAHYGIHYWLQTMAYGENKAELEAQFNAGNNEVEAAPEEKPNKKKYKLAKQKKKSQRHIKREKQEKKAEMRLWYRSVRTHFWSLAVVGLSAAFFTKNLVMHHKFNDEKDYNNLIVTGVLAFLLILCSILWRYIKNIQFIRPLLIGLVAVGAISFTLITEPPDAHVSGERDAMTELSNLYQDSYLKKYPLYVNHMWFFWANDMSYSNDEYGTITQENLKKAPVGSIVLWESHYSHRLAGDVQYTYFKNNNNFVELCKVISDDRKFTAALLQKIDPQSDKPMAVKNKFIKEHPDFGYAYYSKAEYLKDNGKNQQALQVLDTLQQKLPDYAATYFLQGLVCFNMNQNGEAAKSFKKVLDYHPDYYQAEYNLSISLVRQRKFKEAIPHLKNVIEQAEKYSNAYEQLAGVYFNLQNYSEAIKYYGEYIKLNPKKPQGYFNAANCYFRAKDYKNAVTYYDKTLQLQPQYAVAHFNKGIALGNLGKKAEACNSLAKAAKLGYQQANAYLEKNCR